MEKQKNIIMLKRFVNQLNSMSNYLILLKGILFLSFNMFSQVNDERLYFITGTIDNILPGVYYSYLFKYNNHGLDTVAILSNDSTKLKFVKAYHDQRIVLVLKDGYIYNDTFWFMVISMDNPADIKTLNLGNTWDITSEHLVLYNDSLYYLFDGGEYFGVNVKTLSIKNFYYSLELLKNAIIKGDVGGVMENKTKDYIVLNHNARGDSVYVHAYVYEKVYLDCKIPDSLISAKKKYYVLKTNNNKYMVIRNNSSDYNQSRKLGTSDLIIYNKETKQWNKLTLKGNIVNMINFGDWLAGWVMEGYDDKNGFYWISPGEKDRKKENNELGSTFDERAEGVYMPGILYLYNMETKQYIEWNTNQGDSEILLVHDGVVYYRVADKIYKASIIEGKSIGKPELIIQDERVHDIHWAFISKNK